MLSKSRAKVLTAAFLAFMLLTSAVTLVDWSQIKNRPKTLSDYNFATQHPTGTIGIGTNSVVFRPVPLGVNGTDVGHYILVGGTGTPEACLINGGSGTSGQAVGTITMLCAGSHSVGYSVNSDSGGIEEMLADGNRSIIVPAGTYNTHQEIFLGNGGSINCADKANTIIQTNLATQNAFHINGSNAGKIDNCTINTAVVKTAGAAFLIDGGNGFSLISNNIVTAAYNCFDSEAAITWGFQNNYCVNVVANGVINHYIAFPDSGDSNVTNNVFSAPSATGACISYGSGGGMRVISNKCLGFAYSVDLSLDDGATTSIFLVEVNSFENTTVGGVRIRRLGSGNFSLITISGNQFSMPANVINVGAGFAGVNVSFNHINFGTGTGILLASADNMVSSNTMFGGTVGIDVSASTLATILVNNQINSAGTNWIGNAITSSSNPADLFTFATLPTAAASGSTTSCVNCTIGSNPCTVGASITPVYRSGVMWRCM